MNTTTETEVTKMQTKVVIIVNHENWSANTFIMETLAHFIDDCNADSMEGWSMKIVEITELEEVKE